MASEQVEEYLEAIYGLTEEGKKASTTELARALNVKPASVTEMLKKLDKEKYVKYEPYKGVTLTKKGLKIGSKIKRKHRILERFLVDILGLRKEKVHEEACKLEHALSDEAEQALEEMMGYPDKCPDDGKSIPGAAVKLKEGEQRLIHLNEGDKAKIIKFIHGRHAVSLKHARQGEKFKRTLRAMGIREGKIIEFKARHPLGGPLVVKLGNTTLTIGCGMASKIIVEKI